MFQDEIIIKLKEVFEELSSKVRSISLIHEQLYSQETFDSLNIGDYFKSLCEYYSHLKSEEGKIEFTYDIDSIFLNITKDLISLLLFIDYKKINENTII